MSLESCRIVLSDGKSIIFGIEDKIFNRNRPQAVQLSGLGAPKLNINSSDLVGGGRFIYGSFIDQREISFALAFPSIGVYKKCRDFLENEAMQDSLECSQENDRKLELIFKSSSGINYKIRGFFNEIKTDFFTDDPILWGNFVCFDDNFIYDVIKNDEEKVFIQRFNPGDYDEGSVSYGSKISWFDGSRYSATKYWRLPDNWDKHDLPDSTVFVGFNTPNANDISEVNLYLYETSSGDDIKISLPIIRSLKRPSFPSEAKSMAVRVNGTDVKDNEFTVMYWDSAKPLSGNMLGSYTDTFNGSVNFKDAHLRSQKTSKVEIETLSQKERSDASMPKNIYIIVDSPNPSYIGGDTVLTKRSIHDV